MSSQNTAIASTAAQHANAEIVRRGYGAFNTGDLDLLTKLFDENVSWHTPGRGMLAGDRKGRAAVFEQFGKYVGETNGTFKAELKYVAADEQGRVVGVHHNTGERNGKRLDVDCCLVVEVRDGRVISGREHFYDLHSWDEFWL
jgi:hypothetical protein